MGKPRQTVKYGRTYYFLSSDISDSGKPTQLRPADQNSKEQVPIVSQVASLG